MTLPEFLTTWDERNLAAHRGIDLFDPEKSKMLTAEQRIYFAKIFYHARGHFHDFLWFMGSYTPSVAQKIKSSTISPKNLAAVARMKNCTLILR